MKYDIVLKFSDAKKFLSKLGLSETTINFYENMVDVSSETMINVQTNVNILFPTKNGNEVELEDSIRYEI